jgi:cullin 3
MGYNCNNQKLNVYKTDLEKFIIEHAGAFYKRQSRTWMDQDSCPNYLKKAEKMLQAEKNRVDSYLHRSTMEPLQKECYIQLLKVHQTELINKKTGVDALLTADAREDLTRLFRMYKGYPEDIGPIADLVEKHIEREGSNIIKKAQVGGHELVQQLISLHARYDAVLKDCFEKNPVFQKALKKAFETFINQDDKLSRLLANFINDVLTRGTTVTLTEGLEKTLDNVVFLYGYIQEKDVFERHYQLFLANRLLNGLCDSEHSEKSMIAKLRAEAGYQWCNKLEGMFKDVQASRDLMGKFKKQYDAEAKVGLDLAVNVCSSGYWPTTANIPYHLPADLSAACDKFKRFYLNQHNGHKLIWHMDKGRAEVLVHFGPKVSRTLVGTTYQMMILLVFNNAKRVTFRQILDITGIPKSEISHHLLSLVHPKVAIVLKRPNTKTLEDSHQFMLNPKYFNKLLKVVIPLMQPIKKGDDEEEEDKKLIELQRRHQMDAAIVRIMKIRKTMKHPLLVAEVIAQLKARFVPKPAKIKKRIEALIEQEYLERDKADRSVYKYLA